MQQGNRRWMFWLVLVVLAAPVASADGQILLVNRNVNLRETASTALPPIRLIRAGEVLTPLDLEPTDGYFPAATPEGEEGWVWSRNVSLLELPPELPPYDRRDWRHWIDEDRDCQNTRTEVLIRDALSVVMATRSDGRQCAVQSGVWVDPFSGDTIRDPRGLDVDHVVPLQNAHLAGAWSWDSARRREYANDMADPQHLLAVTASLNRQKGAKGPDQWLPPNPDFSCSYIAAWRAIKRRWRLTTTVAERATMDSVRTARNCPP